MSTKQPKSLSEIVSGAGSPLQDLAARAEKRLALAEFLRRGLTEELAAHIVAANIHTDGCLVVLTDAPEWAARLRFESGLLLSLCRKQHPEATHAKIRVTSAG
jgi:hypothetical protein